MNESMLGMGTQRNFFPYNGERGGELSIDGEYAPGPLTDPITNLEATIYLQI